MLEGFLTIWSPWWNRGVAGFLSDPTVMSRLDGARARLGRVQREYEGYCFWIDEGDDWRKR